MTGKEIKNLRKKLGLTQVALARATGYTPNHIQKFEYGTVKVSRRFVLELTNFLERGSNEKNGRVRVYRPENEK
jgi:transcriptional regulator with XRE-family HTH domain